MESGMPVIGCEKCYATEASGHQSLRMIYNELMPAEPSSDTDVSWFDLSLGNKCNQACRICGPHNSTGWLADMDGLRDLEWAHVNRVRVTRPVVDGLDKIGEIISLMDASPPGFTIELKGGEPLYMDANRRLLSMMVERGLHRRTGQLRIMTNGTVADAELVSLLSRFDDINLAISIDAVGGLHCYTRGLNVPWDECLRRWDRLRRMPNVRGLRIANTIYAYNAFGMGRLAEWKDSELGTDVPMANAVLHRPDYLGLSVLTPGMRRAAMVDLPDDHPALPHLSRQEDGSEPRLRERFRLFTGRLDAIRGESLVDLVPELAPLMMDDGT